MKMFNLYKVITCFTAILCCYLFFLLSLSPQSFLLDLGIEGNDAAYFISRRAGMLMLGISVLLFFARNAVHSQARQAITLSISITMFGLIIAGSYEFLRGYVNSAIFGPIIIESILALSFFYIWLSNNKKSQPLLLENG